MIERSSTPEVRNPILAIPGADALRNLAPEPKAALRALLLGMRADAQAKAEKCWRTHKAPMALYWKVLAVYTGHIARLLRPEAVKS